MSQLTKEIEEHYLQGIEGERLSSNEGELERLRTQSILTGFLPPPPAVVLDIGGGTGIYAFPLAQMGYQVHLIDPVELHLEQARSHSHKEGVRLASIGPGNACKLDFASGVADAVLLLGPLYHLVEHTDRLAALREAYRVLKPGGVVFAAAISRFASLNDGLLRGYFKDPTFRDIIAADLATGQHRNSANNSAYFTTAYFHRPEDLVREVSEAGLEDVRVLAVEGPVWNAVYFRDTWAIAEEREKLMQFLAMIEAEPSIQGASAHLIAVAYRPV
jgi:ubiquinone/menaquinone biosynthesis C-methylase UbiE